MDLVPFDTSLQDTDDGGGRVWLFPHRVTADGGPHPEAYRLSSTLVAG